MQIVLVHGIWDTGKIFRQMVHFLNQRGHQCHAPDLNPSNGANGLTDLSLKLDEYIRRTLGEDNQFALIGFSMGSLVSRYYLQQLGGLERVSHFFSLSGPHRGTINAHLWPGKAAQDMRFKSDFLNRLNSEITRLENLPTKTYRTPFDLLIVPSRSSILPHAENRIICAPFHHLMPRQKSIMQDIAETLDASSKESEISDIPTK